MPTVSAMQVYHAIDVNWDIVVCKAERVGGQTACDMLG